ncbi:hypothetical protein FHU41_001861 [Psychromicrobium silvestre]|uniref:Uncharacterized protein n=1 Tax=Psychromicrobium silvestre TaxID=1645614 RepID=A0A7Y9LU41_9MICC|nr:hypothetical protein [Psychromicrobium silvestre]NYE95611.1 hypothetical protein [Psychromicrobium silvestre]
MQISRRAALGVAPAAFGAIFLNVGSAHASGETSTISTEMTSSQANGVKITVTAVPQTCFNPGFTRAITWQQPLRIDFSGKISKLGGTRLIINFDNRVARWTGIPAIWTHGGNPAEVSSHTTGTPNPMMDQLQINLPAQLSDIAPGAAAAQLYLPLDTLPLYPLDNIAPVNPTKIEVEALPKFLLVCTATIPEIAGTPWGAELSAVWARLNLSGKGYSVPRSVRIQSVGPGPIPAGTLLKFTGDSGVVASLDLGSAVLTETGAPFPTVIRTGSKKLPNSLHRELILKQDIPAKTSITLNLISTTNQQKLSDRDVSFATVELIATKGKSALVRQTGRYSLSRVTSSGKAQLSDSLIS